jgi:hypothetical protein
MYTPLGDMDTNILSKLSRGSLRCVDGQCPFICLDFLSVGTQGGTQGTRSLVNLKSKII